MRIFIKTDEGRHIRLLLPTRLLFNLVTAAIAAKALRKQQIPLSRTQIMQLMQTILDYRRQRPDWVLIDVESSDGKTVYIKL